MNGRILALALLACALSPALQAAGTFRLDDKDVKLTGCLVKGEGDGSGYLVTNLPAEPAAASANGAQVVTSAIGTTGGFSTIFYWLDGNGDLKRHIGHRVEIEGRLKGDLKEGELKLERKDNWTEVTVKSDGRTMKATVPNASIFPASNREDSTRKVGTLVRKVDVEHVRMVAARCE